MFFDDWSGLLRVLIVGSAAYISLVFLLRISGKRTLSKLNAFDLVVTVALGSTLATVLLNDNVALAEGVLAMALLIFLQFAITWLSVRSEGFQNLVKGDPTLVLFRGHYLDQAMAKQRLTREEVRAAIRAHGNISPEKTAAVVLETDGTLSIITDVPAQCHDAATLLR